jgi:AcrR family transcriptional regulator
VPKRLTREEQKARTRSLLMEAAARVFARKGYHAATVDDVAQEAGFTKGAFYSNFASKDDVFIALVEDRSLNWTLAVARAYAGSEPLLERLEKGGRFLTQMLEREADWMLLSNEMWSQSVRTPQLRARLAAAYQECREVIARAIEEAERELELESGMDPEGVATLMIALTDGFVLQQLADPERLPPSLLADGIALFFGGLMFSSSRPPGSRR